MDTVTLLSDEMSTESRTACATVLHTQFHVQDRRLGFIFGFETSEDRHQTPLLSVQTEATDQGNRAVVDGGTTIPIGSEPFVLRRWEVVQDATPTIGENDTGLSLSLFGARKSVL